MSSFTRLDEIVANEDHRAALSAPSQSNTSPSPEVSSDQAPSTGASRTAPQEAIASPKTSSNNKKKESQQKVSPAQGNNTSASPGSSNSASGLANEPVSNPAARPITHTDKDRRILEQLQEKGIAPVGCHVWLVKEGKGSDHGKNSPPWALIILGARLGAGNGWVTRGTPVDGQEYFDRFNKRHELCCKFVWWFCLECQFRLCDTVPREYVAFVVYHGPENASDGVRVTVQKEGTDKKEAVGEFSERDHKNSKTNVLIDDDKSKRSIFVSEPFMLEQGQTLLKVMLKETHRKINHDDLVVSAIGISPADGKKKKIQDMQAKAESKDRKEKTAAHNPVTKGSKSSKRKGASKVSKKQKKPDAQNKVVERPDGARFERLYMDLLGYRTWEIKEKKRNNADEGEENQDHRALSLSTGIRKLGDMLVKPADMHPDEEMNGNVV